MSWQMLREHRTFRQTDAPAHATSEEKGYSEVGVLFLYRLLLVKGLEQLGGVEVKQEG